MLRKISVIRKLDKRWIEDIIVYYNNKDLQNNRYWKNYYYSDMNKEESNQKQYSQHLLMFLYIVCSLVK